MTEVKALLLVFAGMLLSATVAILGLRAAGANEAALLLGALIPLVLGSHAISRVVMHYGSSRRRHR